MVANVAEIGCAEQGVADDVYEHVGVGMPQRAVGVRHPNAAEPERPAFHQLVHVVALSNSKIQGDFKV